MTDWQEAYEGFLAGAGVAGEGEEVQGEEPLAPRGLLDAIGRARAADHWGALAGLAGRVYPLSLVAPCPAKGWR